MKKVIKKNNKIIDLEPLSIIESDLKANESFMKIDNSHRKSLEEVIKLMVDSHIENECELYFIDRNDLQLRELLQSNNMCEIVYDSKLKVEDRLELADLDGCITDLRFVVSENLRYIVSKVGYTLEGCTDEDVIESMKNLTMQEYNEEVSDESK